MARILYSVCGIGFGHATRSTPILDALVQSHELIIVSHDGSFDYLKKRYSNVKRIQGFHLEYDHATLDKSETIVKNARELPNILYSNLSKFTQLIRSFKPDVIITDFEPTAVYAGTLFGIPVLTITNMHLMNFIFPTLTVKDKLNYYLTEKTVMKAFGPSKYYLITCLMKPSKPAAKKKVLFFNPIVREPILAVQSTYGHHTLVYVEKQSLSELISLLKLFPNEHFIIYNSSKSKREQNLEFKPFSEKSFIQDLTQCKAVICHGGISLLSESLVLGKPVYVYSDKNFFERYYNGWLLQEQGFGLVEEKLTQTSLNWFFLQVPKFQENLQQRKPLPGNKELIEKLEQLIKELSQNKSKIKLF